MRTKPCLGQDQKAFGAGGRTLHGLPSRWGVHKGVLLLARAAMARLINLYHAALYHTNEGNFFTSFVPFLEFVFGWEHTIQPCDILYPVSSDASVCAAGRSTSCWVRCSACKALPGKGTPTCLARVGQAPLRRAAFVLRLWSRLKNLASGAWSLSGVPRVIAGLEASPERASAPGGTAPFFRDHAPGRPTFNWPSVYVPGL